MKKRADEKETVSGRKRIVTSRKESGEQLIYFREESGKQMIHLREKCGEQLIHFQGNCGKQLTHLRGKCRKQLIHLRKKCGKQIVRFWKDYGRTALLLLCFSLLLRVSVSAAHRSLLQQGISDEVLRFHVLANSDSREDQQVKLLVRDAVLAWIEDTAELSAGTETTKEELMTFLQTHLQGIEQAADEVLKQQGMEYRAAAALENCYFPERTYGDCTFPAGWYEALRIRLGEARGQNWWCVLYPKLCFEDCLHAVVEEEQKEELSGVLTVEEYESLLRDPGEWKIAFRWF